MNISKFPGTGPRRAAWLVLGNPLRLNAQALLEDMNRIYPGVPVYGGLATGGWDPETLFTFHHAAGLVDSAGVAVHLPDMVVQGIVSQGCQPIGEPYTITQVDKDVVLGVGGRRAYDVLVETFENLRRTTRKWPGATSWPDWRLVNTGMISSGAIFWSGTSLEAIPKAGALKIGAIPRVGQTHSVSTARKRRGGRGFAGAE